VFGRVKIEGRDRQKILTERVGTLPQSVRRSFNKIGFDEAMRRTREIIPLLRERAQRAEDTRMLIRENEVCAGLLHIIGRSGESV
jgi:hypothetical protein